MNEPKKKILIVEDEVAMLHALEEGFAREGFNVMSADEGGAGYSKAIEYKPDLIILDILLPGINGLDMIKKLRRDGGSYGKNVPVIILTNLNPDDEEVNETITATSPTYYLVKADWTVEDVIEKARERLSQVP